MTTIKSRVCALIPAYNEADRIAVTIEALRNRPEIDEIVVVDDGSTDDTVATARAAGASAVVTQPNAGKGAALSRAFREGRDLAEIFLLLDADLGASASEAVKLIRPIVVDEADMTVGLLPADPDFAATGQSGGAGFVVRLANEGIRKATGQTFKQPLCGQRGVKKGVLDTLSDGKDGGNIFAKGFGVEVGLTIDALRAGFRIVEVETQFRHKVTGSDWRGKLHRARQFLDVRSAINECSKS